MAWLAAPWRGSPWPMCQDLSRLKDPTNNANSCQKLIARDVSLIDSRPLFHQLLHGHCLNDRPWVKTRLLLLYLKAGLCKIRVVCGTGKNILKFFHPLCCEEYMHYIKRVGAEKFIWISHSLKFLIVLKNIILLCTLSYITMPYMFLSWSTNAADDAIYKREIYLIWDFFSFSNYFFCYYVLRSDLHFSHRLIPINISYLSCLLL